jgi:hypothetical protein
MQGAAATAKGAQVRSETAAQPSRELQEKLPHGPQPYMELKETAEIAENYQLTEDSVAFRWRGASFLRYDFVCLHALVFYLTFRGR